MNYFYRALLLSLSALIFTVPFIASAHEVYVLSPNAISAALQAPPLPILDIIKSEEARFFFWGLLISAILLTVFFISISRGLERILDPILEHLRRYAPLVGRLTLGISVLAAVHYGAIFGPELPFTAFLPVSYIPAFKIFLLTTGTLVTIGLWTRAAAALLMAMYVALFFVYGVYMITYTNYFGEMVISFVLGSNILAVDRLLRTHPFVYLKKTAAWFEYHAFLILRACFGLSLIYASFYAKFLHANLAIQTVTIYGLTNYFHFDPPFLVLGAFILEVSLGLLFILGIEIRFAALFLLTFLTLSLLYFGEAVWPHIILAGTAIAIFMQGYGPYTLERKFLQRVGRPEEPVL